MTVKKAGSNENDFTIRIPLDMIQHTGTDGKAWPIMFKWPDVDGVPSEVRIDRIRSVTNFADKKSGTVGDRYECEIEGQTVYIYYTKLAPRKWFKIVPVSEKEYKSYYPLPGEKPLMVAESEVPYRSK